MEVVSVKFQEEVLKKIDESIHINNFNSRTEFIREAVRDKLDCLDRDALVKSFLSFRGKASKKTTEKQNQKTKIEAGRELIAEFEKRFG